LRAGLDADYMPLLKPLRNTPEGVEVTVACSSLHSPTSRDFGRNLAEIADHFVDLVGSLKRAQIAA
jgi:hypothetical protein